MGQISSNGISLVLFPLFAASLSMAQTFQTPSISAFTKMVEGTQYSITCSCVAVGANVTLVWKRSDQSSSFAGNTTCSPVPNLPDYASCTAVYTFRATWEDAGVNVTCIGLQAGNSETKQDTTTLNLRYKPHSVIQNPVITTAIGKAVTLKCQTNANPAATTFKWSFGGVTLSETGPSLEVNPTNKSFFGNYTCEATSEIGASGPIILTLGQVAPVTSGNANPACGLISLILTVACALAVSST